MINIFERGTREGVRFATKRGQLLIEDLWALDVSSLATLGKGLRAELKPLQEDDDEFSIAPSKTTSKTVQTLELKIAIIKHIMSVKSTEKAAKDASAAERQAKDQRIEELKLLIANKKGEADQLRDLNDLEEELSKLTSN